MGGSRTPRPLPGDRGSLAGAAPAEKLRDVCFLPHLGRHCSAEGIPPKTRCLNQTTGRWALLALEKDMYLLILLSV